MARTPTLSEPFTPSQVGALTPFQDSRGLSADAAGGAMSRQLIQFGQDLNAAAERTGQMVVQQQDIANRAAAADVNNLVRTDGLKAWDAYRQLQGRAAAEGYDDYVAKLTQIRDGAMGLLQSDAQRSMAEAGVNDWFLSMTEGGMNHRATETQSWQITTAQATAASYVNQGMLYRDEFDKMHTAVEEGVTQGIFAEAQARGWDPIVADMKANEYRGNAYSAYIQSIAQDDPIKAQALFEEVAGDIDAVSAAQIEAYLKPKVDQAQADAIVATVSGQGSSNVPFVMGSLNNMGWSPVAAAGITGGLQAESYAHLNPMASNNIGGGHFGLAQWGRARLGSGPDDEGTLRWYAAQAGLDYRTKEAQVGFINWELNNTEKTAGDMLRAATTPYEAAAAMVAYERPDGYTDAAHPETVNDWAIRLRYAEQLFAGNPGTATGAAGTPGGVVAPAAVGTVQGFGPSGAQMMQDAMGYTQGNPDLARATLSSLNSYITQRDAATAQARAQMDQQIADLGAVLETPTGWATPIPTLASLQQLYSPEEAQRQYGALLTSAAVGQIADSIQVASPQQIAELRDAISGAVPGKYDDYIRSAFGLPPGTNMEDPTFLRAQQSMLNAFDIALARRQEAISKDPAAYAMRVAGVGTAANELAANPSPEAWQRYATATIATQERLGVLNPTLLTDQMRTSFINGIENGDPKAANMYLGQLQQQTGASWPQVFAELTTGPGAIADEYRAMGLMHDPVARTVFADVLMAEKEDAGSTRRAVSGQATAIDNQVEDAMAAFNRTFAYGAGGASVANNLTSAVKLLAYRWAPVNGPEVAVDRATNAIMGQYDISMTIGDYEARSPAGLGDTMQTAADTIKQELRAGDLMPTPDYRGLYSADLLQEITLQDARRGTWVTSPDETGWVLFDNTNGSYVQHADGSPVFLPYEGAADVAARYVEPAGALMPMVPQEQQPLVPPVGEAPERTLPTPEDVGKMFWNPIPVEPEFFDETTRPDEPFDPNLFPEGQ